MNKSISISFFMILFLLIPKLGKTVVVPTETTKKERSEVNLTAEDLLKLTNKELEAKIGRKLKFKEKIAFRILKKRLKKQANKKPGDLKMQPLAIWGLSFSIASVLFSLLILLTGGIGLILALICGTLGIVFSSIALRKITRDPEKLKGKGMALTGMIMGIVVTGTWLILIIVALIALAYDII